MHMNSFSVCSKTHPNANTNPTTWRITIRQCNKIFYKIHGSLTAVLDHEFATCRPADQRISWFSVLQLKLAILLSGMSYTVVGCLVQLSLNWTKLITLTLSYTTLSSTTHTVLFRFLFETCANIVNCTVFFFIFFPLPSSVILLLCLSISVCLSDCCRHYGK